MIRYADGTQAQVGDHVDYDGHPGVVDMMVDTADEQRRLGVEQRGILIMADMDMMILPPNETEWKSYHAEGDLFFQAVDACTWNGIVFIRRRA